MLVLSRQKDESIVIGDDVEIMIVDVRGDKVRLGIVAPKEISVHRKEVYDAIQREKAEKKEQEEKEVPSIVLNEPSDHPLPPEEDLALRVGYNKETGQVLIDFGAKLDSRGLGMNLKQAAEFAKLITDTVDQNKS